MTFNISTQGGAAPSMYLKHVFSSNDAILKMQKIKVVQSAFASFFAVNSFTKVYTGLQQTPDPRYRHPNVLISSLWDIDTANGIYSNVSYHDPTTITSRFGGEGNGWKTMNAYKWQMNTWYNLVNRAWKSNGNLYIGTFINDLSTGKWFHTATLLIPDPGTFLEGRNDAFLENWDCSEPSCNGSSVRKAFFKDCWNLNTNANWEKNISTSFSANDDLKDIQRNGIYHNSFNAFYDTFEDAYCMQHGGNTAPSAEFNGGRTLQLPTQANQGTTPILTTAVISSVTAHSVEGKTNIEWTIDEYKAPLLSAKVEINDSSGTVVKTIQDTLPERRSFEITGLPNEGDYIAKITVIDIFNQESQPVITNIK